MNYAMAMVIDAAESLSPEEIQELLYIDILYLAEELAKENLLGDPYHALRGIAASRRMTREDMAREAPSILRRQAE